MIMHTYSQTHKQQIQMIQTVLFEVSGQSMFFWSIFKNKKDCNISQCSLTFRTSKNCESFSKNDFAESKLHRTLSEKPFSISLCLSTVCIPGVAELTCTYTWGSCGVCQPHARQWFPFPYVGYFPVFNSHTPTPHPPPSLSLPPLPHSLSDPVHCHVSMLTCALHCLQEELTENQEIIQTYRLHIAQDINQDNLALFYNSYNR